MADPINILVTGGQGQIGQALAKVRWAPGVNLLRPTRAELDLTDVEALNACFERQPFHAVINAAAFTAVDLAETHVGDAVLSNALIPARLADLTRRADIPLVHISTDFVFDGESDRPYAEHDPANPINVYGASKRAGELAVLSGHPRGVVVRTAWVVSARGRNFARKILEAAAHQGVLSVVADTIGSPTSADDLAKALETVTTAMISDPSAPTGVYHCVNAGQASWAELAAELVRLAGLATTVVGIPSAQYPSSARRPRNSRLSCDRLCRDHGVTMRDWRTSLADVVSEIERERLKS